MPVILYRYLFWQILKSWLAVLLVLGLVLLSHSLGYVLGEISEGSLPEGALWPLMLKESSLTLTTLIPISVFLGTVFALGRLYADHEMAVLRSCGMQTWQLFQPVLLVGLLAAALSAAFSFWISPTTGSYSHAIVQQENNLKQVKDLRPGQFTLSNDKTKVFYIEGISEDKNFFYNIIVHDNSKQNTVIEVADSAFQKTDPETGDLFLVMGPGVRYEGEPGQADYEVTHYRQHGILLQQKQQQQKPLDIGSLPSRVVMQSKLLPEQIEWLTRQTIPVASLLLTLLALPLAHLAPRQGRFGKTGAAIGVYIFYAALISANGAWLSDRKVSLELGYWWVHGVIIALMLLLLWRRWRGSGA